MNQPDRCANCRQNHRDRVMSPEQFTQVIEAILAGKYSWACVLILRFAGYNPLHYIPYRTYNRLQKEHEQSRRGCRSPLEGTQPVARSASSVPQLADLAYLEVLHESSIPVRGGRFNQWMGHQVQRFASFGNYFGSSR
jgi:hypothetical protein